MSDRKALVQKLITKLKGEIQELREFYNEMLAEDLPDGVREFYPEKTCRLNLNKLDFVEDIFCDEQFYDREYSNQNWIIDDEHLELLIIRDLSTARDLMESVHFTSRFMISKHFQFNLLSVFEYGLLKDQLKKEDE